MFSTENFLKKYRNGPRRNYQAVTSKKSRIRIRPGQWESSGVSGFFRLRLKKTFKKQTNTGFFLTLTAEGTYLKVGNGGFGPGYGLFGIAGGAPAITGDGHHRDVVSFYQLHIGGQAHPKLSHDFSAQGSLFLNSLEQWFDQLELICSWGCHHRSLLDFSKDGRPVLHHIGYGGELIL